MSDYINANRTWFSPYYPSYPYGPDDLVPVPKEPSFETNLTEPLRGWRAWSLRNDSGRPYGYLTSCNYKHRWFPDEPFTASCALHAVSTNLDVPREHCTCGVYAVNDIKDIPYPIDDDLIFGQVYGWGRYVRGADGWRAQFAYPHCFHLRASQRPHIETLRTYHVPIFIDQPVCAYDPTGEGYHNENWKNFEDRNLGAALSAYAPETDYSREDHQDDEDDNDD